jgi:hypothetical protein
MKKSIIFSLSLVIISVVSANAQGFQLGVNGYSLGGFLALKITKHIGIQPEVLWNQYQLQTTTDASSVNSYLPNGNNIKLNYLTIPILLNITPAKILTFQIGPQFGILINNNEPLTDNSKDAFKKGDFSMVGGAQLNLAWFKLGARYFIGLNNIYDLGNEDKWTNQGVQIYVGIRII